MRWLLRNLLSLLLLTSPLMVGAQSVIRDSAINTRYHTYEEIVAYMDSIQTIAAYNMILDVVEIGRSNNEDLPIYAIKLSDNPTVDEDEPALLFLGQCHAEEILGVEITMGLVDSLLHGFDAMNSTVVDILQNTEVWVVPTYNPEGLRVVHDGWDVTYRKNKTDNNHNGIFDYVDGIGYDIDGVDFNRNYDFNWVFGDAYEVGDYDYYRGPEPFSESETRAVAALAKQEKFLLSVAYHSARSGTPEIIYYSWEWEATKTPPDVEIMSGMANILSQRVLNESGDGNYAVTPGKTPRGNAHDWFYTQTGSIQFLIEVGTNNLQPNADIVDDTVDRNLEGLFYLLNRSFGRSPESKAQIRGIVTDASDGFSLENAQIQLAKLTVDGGLINLEGLMMQPRVTDGFGRYRRLVEQGTYRVIASAPGFVADTVDAILVSDSYATILDFSLTPMDVHPISLNLTMSEGIDYYDVFLWDETRRDTMVLSPGTHNFDWQGNNLNLLVSAPGYFPEEHNYDLSSFAPEHELNLSVSLPVAPVTAYSTGFDDLSGWTIHSGSWLAENGELLSQTDLFYEAALPMEMELPLIDLSVLPEARRLGLYIKHQFEVEWDYDTLSLELWSGDQTELLLHKQWFDQNYSGVEETFLITGDLPASARLKLKMSSDSTVVFRGWEIDSLALFLTASELVGLEPEVLTERSDQNDHQLNTYSATLTPNPFRKQTSFSYELPQAVPTTITIYDLRGRQIYTENLHSAGGANSWTWAGQDMLGHPVSAGIYFLRLSGPEVAITRKLMIVDNF